MHNLSVAAACHGRCPIVRHQTCVVTTSIIVTDGPTTFPLHVLLPIQFFISILVHVDAVHAFKPATCLLLDLAGLLAAVLCAVPVSPPVAMWLSTSPDRVFFRFSATSALFALQLQRLNDCGLVVT